MTQEPQRFRDTIIFPASLDPDAVRVVTRLQDQGFESYLVGGCVRDLLAGRIPKDFDVSTEARPRQIRRVFRNSRIIGRRFKLAHVHFGSNIIEVATFRRTPDEAPNDEAASEDTPTDEGESAVEVATDEPPTDADVASDETPAEASSEDSADEASDEDREDSQRERGDGRRRRGGRRRRRRGDDAPDTAERDGLLIVRDNEFGNAEEDVIRRDFTINALLYDVKKEEVIDYVGGVQDLNDRVMRTIGDAPLRLAEDPVRMLRAVKFTSRLDLHLDDELDAAMRSCAHLIERSAAPRVLEEIYKFLTCGNAERALDMLVEYDLLTYLLPEIAPHWNAHRDDLRALGAAIDKLDGGRRSLSNGFLLAALFCPIWRDMLDEGSDPVAVARDVISPAAQRMSIPRKDVAEVKQLLATLLRLERNRRSRRVRIQEYLKRSSTRDAIQLLHLFARAGLSDPELHARWSYRLAALDPEPPAAVAKASSDDDASDGDRPRKKRRRRRGGRRSKNQRANRERHEETDSEETRSDAPTSDEPKVPSETTEAPEVVETPQAEAPDEAAEVATTGADAPREPSGIKRLVRRLFHRVRRSDDAEAGATEAPAADANESANAEAESPAPDAEAKTSAETTEAKADETPDGDGEARPRAKRRRRGGRRRRSGSKTSENNGEGDSASAEKNSSSNHKDGDESKSKDSQSKRRRSSSKKKKTSSRGGRRDGDDKPQQRKSKKKRSTKSKSEDKKSDGEFGQRHPEDVEDFFDW